jgi:hypothetical protein
MPRDLAAMRRGNDEPKDKISRDMDKQDHLAEIKPYVQALTISDVDSAVKLEDAAFPPEERATREKVIVPPSLHFVSLPPNPTRDHVAHLRHPKPTVVPLETPSASFFISAQTIPVVSATSSQDHKKSQPPHVPYSLSRLSFQKVRSQICKSCENHCRAQD